jgi:hypothetical protein
LLVCSQPNPEGNELDVGPGARERRAEVDYCLSIHPGYLDVRRR